MLKSARRRNFRTRSGNCEDHCRLHWGIFFIRNFSSEVSRSCEFQLHGLMKFPLSPKYSTRTESLRNHGKRLGTESRQRKNRKDVRSVGSSGILDRRPKNSRDSTVRRCVNRLWQLLVGPLSRNGVRDPNASPNMLSFRPIRVHGAKVWTLKPHKRSLEMFQAKLKFSGREVAKHSGATDSPSSETVPRISFR